MTDLKYCIYCDRNKPEAEFSLEHIWPDTLGGDLLPDLFKTEDVCANCNNLCGLYVDGAFVKSILTKFETSISASVYTDPKKPSYMPFAYIGFDQDFPCKENEVCERWIGAAGEHLYHVHEKDDDQWGPYAGGDIIKRKKKNPGRAYMSLTSKEDYWILVATISFKKQFKTAKRCITNCELLPDIEHYEKLKHLFPTPDMDDKVQAEELNYIMQRGDNIVHSQGVIDLGFEQRFLCKFALALGHKLLGKRFVETTYAKELRKGLWCKDFKERQKIKVRGTGAFNNDIEALKSLGDFLSIDAMWCITLKIVGDCLSAIITSPSAKMRTIVISDEPELWSDNQLQYLKDGHCYLFIPEISIALAPLLFSSMLAHKLKITIEPSISDIEKLRISREQLPEK